MIYSQIPIEKTESSCKVRRGLLPLFVLYRCGALPWFLVPAFQSVLGGARQSLSVIDMVHVFQAFADRELAQCATYYHHLIFATAWNISADIALLVIPFLIIPQTRLPLKRKILINCVLGLGVFNVRVA